MGYLSGLRLNRLRSGNVRIVTSAATHSTRGGPQTVTLACACGGRRDEQHARSGRTLCLVVGQVVGDSLDGTRWWTVAPTWLYVFAAVFLLFLGMLVGSGLDTERRKRLNDEHAEYVRWQRMRHPRF